MFLLCRAPLELDPPPLKINVNHIIMFSMMIILTHIRQLVKVDCPKRRGGIILQSHYFSHALSPRFWIAMAAQKIAWEKCCDLTKGKDFTHLVTERNLPVLTCWILTPALALPNLQKLSPGGRITLQITWPQFSSITSYSLIINLPQAPFQCCNWHSRTPGNFKAIVEILTLCISRPLGCAWTWELQLCGCSTKVDRNFGFDSN